MRQSSSLAYTISSTPPKRSRLKDTPEFELKEEEVDESSGTSPPVDNVSVAADQDTAGSTQNESGEAAVDETSNVSYAL